MRVKTDAVDYKYFPEPNITPIALSDEFVQNAIDTCPELYDAKKARYVASGLSDTDAEIILSDLAMATYFEEASKGAKNLKTVANFLIVEVNGYLNKNGIGIASFPLPASTLCEIANKQEDGYTHKQCADMLSYCLENEGASAEDAIKAKNIVKQSNDEGLVLSLVTKVLDANPQSIEDYKNGKDRAVGFLIGQVMKEAKGKVNPASVAKVMNIELAKR